MSKKKKQSQKKSPIDPVEVLVQLLTGLITGLILILVEKWLD